MLIEAPTNCPSCDSPLVLVTDTLYCKNSSCGSMGRKRVEHFASALKIKGLGPAAIEKLDLFRPEEIYTLTIEEISDSLGAKLADKLYDEIEKSKAKKLNDLLPALGIPLIGPTATAKLANVCINIDSITEQTCNEAGLGPKATQNLLDWLETNDISCYPQDLSFKPVEQKASGGVICLSGKLTSFKNKAEAQKALEELGFTVKTSITKDVTILVNEEGRETAKTQKARQSGILIVENLITFMENI